MSCTDMGVRWKKGLPPGRGLWWVVTDTGVRAVDVYPALNAQLMIKMLSGRVQMAQWLDVYRDIITHHAPLEPPAPPRGGER